jgi:hypothetical protein
MRVVHQFEIPLLPLLRRSKTTSSISKVAPVRFHAALFQGR